MKESHQSSPYFTIQDTNFINLQNLSTVLKPKNDQNSQKIEKNSRQDHFFLELDNQQDYSFLDESFISKKSRKQQKIQQKMRKSSQQQVKNENYEYNHPFSDEISSISCINDQGTPQDSVFSRIIIQLGEKRSNDCEGENLGVQFESQNASFYSSEMMEDEKGEKSFFVSEPPQERQSSEIQIQKEDEEFQQIDQQPNPQNKLANRMEYTFKKSSTQFQKVNRYMLKFLRKTKDGILILPEYSSRLEDVSELGAEGKMLQLKISQPKKIESSSRINIISLLQSKQSEKQKISDDSFQQIMDHRCFKKQKQLIEKEEPKQTQDRNQFRQNNQSNHSDN